MNEDNGHETHVVRLFVVFYLCGSANFAGSRLRVEMSRGVDDARYQWKKTVYMLWCLKQVHSWVLCVCACAVVCCLLVQPARHAISRYAYGVT